MKLNEYQEKAISTAIYPRTYAVGTYPVLGLCGEAGEVAEKVKKVIRDKNGIYDPEDVDNIKKELGDVLWYVANIAWDFNIPLEKVAEMNIEKLQSRKDRGKLRGSGDDR